MGSRWREQKINYQKTMFSASRRKIKYEALEGENMRQKKNYYFNYLKKNIDKHFELVLKLQGA